MDERRTRIGIFGGSFNPVHNGHLRLAVCALSELNLRSVIFVPSCLTPLKEAETLLPAGFRMRLLKAAIRKYPAFSVSGCEIRRRGVSYTVDTLRHFKRKLGPSAQLYFLSGADTLGQISRWKSFDRILRLCRFVVLSRPGVRIPVNIRASFFLPMDALPISSSEIRRRLKRGLSVRGMVPPETVGLLKRFLVNAEKAKNSSRRRRDRI